MTEIRKKNIHTFLHQSAIAHYNVVVLAGNDRGQVSHFVEAVKDVYLAELAADPMACKELSKKQLDEDVSLFINEVDSPSFFVNRNVLKIIEPSEKFTKNLETFADSHNAHCLVIVQAMALSKQSSLRKLASSHPRIAYIACYDDDEKDIMSLIRAKVGASHKTIHSDAISFLASQLGSDRMKTLSEIDKLLIYCHDKNEITLDDVYNSVADVSQFQLDAMCDAIFVGNTDSMTRKLDRALHANFNENQILATLINHVLMIQNILLKTAEQKNLQKIVEEHRPLIFYKRRELILRQCQIWELSDIIKIIHKFNKVQRDMRSQMQIPLLVLKHVMFTIHYIAKQKASRKNRL